MYASYVASLGYVTAALRLVNPFGSYDASHASQAEGDEQMM